MNNKIRLAVVGMMAMSSVVTAFAQGPGADTYKAKCAMCHAADGSGSTPAGKAMKTPPLTSPDILKMSDADLAAVTKSGKGKMPSYSGKLSDGDIKEVVAYIHTLQKK